MKVVIGVPHRSEYDYREWREWFRNKLVAPEGTLIFERRGEALCTMRNGLAMQALEAGAEYLFFLDDDVIGPLNEDGTDAMGLIHLLELAEWLKSSKNEPPFVSGLYWAKKNQKEKSLAAWKRIEQRVGNEAWAPLERFYPAITLDQAGRFVEVDAVGMGFALIHTDLFRKLPQPWFEWKLGGVSEDFYFCELVYDKLGISPVVDMHMICSHIGTYKVLPDGSFDLLKL